MYFKDWKRYLPFYLSIIAAGFIFTGGDCGTENDPVIVVTPPASVNLTLSVSPGSAASAVITWEPSTNENDPEFNGYRVRTFVISDSGTVVSTFSNEIVGRSTHTFTVPGLTPGVKYRTYITAELTSNAKSDSSLSATLIYSGVFCDTAVIDEYTLLNDKSGFGWDVSSGRGTQYEFSSGNFPAIDIHLRRVDGELRLYSPNQITDFGKKTGIVFVGSGSDAYNSFNLPETDTLATRLDENGVYLLKLQSGNYVKLWVKSITTVVGLPSYNEAHFEFRLQPVKDLKVL